MRDIAAQLRGRTVIATRATARRYHIAYTLGNAPQHNYVVNGRQTLRTQGLPWSEEELKTLQSMIREGCTPREIAAHLPGRTHLAVRMRRDRLRMFGFRDRGRPSKQRVDLEDTDEL
jgi:hypothetical protein